VAFDPKAEILRMMRPGGTLTAKARADAFAARVMAPPMGAGPACPTTRQIEAAVQRWNREQQAALEALGLDVDGVLLELRREGLAVCANGHWSARPGKGTGGA